MARKKYRVRILNRKEVRTLNDICKYLSELTLDSANYLYERLGLVFYINDGELI